MQKWRDEGWYVERTEHWDSFARRRKDLLGFGDLLCLTTGRAVLVQVTTKSNMSARIKKINGLDTSAHWKQSGGQIVVEGWYKQDRRWQCKSVTL